MKTRQLIMVAACAVAGMGSVQAQEYLHISNVNAGVYTSVPVAEIDSITIGEVTQLLPAVMESNPRVSLFNEALKATGVDDILNDSLYYGDYAATDYYYYYYVSDFWHEVATVPDTKRRGFTVFATPDEVLQAKYGITSLSDLAAKAKAIYDATYPEDAGKYDDDYTHPKNPLNRYVRYNILTCDVLDWNLITTREIYSGVVQGALGIKTDRMNPIDWYRTLLPNTMMKFEQLTLRDYVGEKSILNDRYINRRYDADYQIEGVWIDPDVEEGLYQDAINGRYFYVDDIVAFTPDVRDKVQNMRIRMDFSTLFPEIITQGIRLNGDPTTDDDYGVADLTFKNGRNYWLPEGYAEDLTINRGIVIYRRPHWNFWSYQGDEFNVFGNYDIELRLPPVPYSGTWQIRLGHCALKTRGTAQIYLDGVAQGEPIDLTIFLNDEAVLGKTFDTTQYTSLTEEERVAEQKKLSAMGYYRGAFGGYHSDGYSINEFVSNPRTYRRVLCETYMDNTQDHYLRIQCVSSSVTGNDHELMLDYLELVPKSVYDNPEKPEDDL